MAEVEKLNVTKRAYKALSTVQMHVEASLQAGPTFPPQSDMQDADEREKDNQH